MKNFRFVAYSTDEGYKNQDPEDAVIFVNKEGQEVTEDGDLVDDASLHS
jgi:hypothetical protein